MKLQRREKILISVVGGLFVTILGFFFFLFGDVAPVERLLLDRTKLKEEVKKKEAQVRAAKEDKARLEDWTLRAVPAEQDIYTDWLRNLATKYITQPFTLAPTQDMHKGIYTSFSFALNGHASLANLTEFLYQFYAAGHLHQITRMVVKPVPNSPNLEISLTVQALSLPGVDRKELSKVQGRGLQQGKKLADYTQPITKRNLFTPFVPIDRKSLDAAQYTFVTGVTEDHGKKLAWIQNRMGGRLWKLGEGEKFDVGDTRGTVQTIDPAKDEVVVEFDGHRRRLRGGENLRGGVEVKE